MSEQESSVLLLDNQTFFTGTVEPVQIEVVCELEEICSEKNDIILLDDSSTVVFETVNVETEVLSDVRNKKYLTSDVNDPREKPKNGDQSQEKTLVRPILRRTTKEMTHEERKLLGNEYMRNFLALKRAEENNINGRHELETVKDKVREPLGSQVVKKKSQKFTDKRKQYKERRNMPMTVEEKAVLRAKIASRWQRLKYKKRTGRIPKVEPPISVKMSTKFYNVSLMKHCIFCLRRTTSSIGVSQVFNVDSDIAERLEEVPCVEECTTTAANLLRVLNRNWSYLQEGGYWDGDAKSGEEQIAEFPRLPAMCRFCGDKLDVIHRLMLNLTQEVNKLGKVMQESRSAGVHSWRVKRFERALRSSCVTWHSVVDTLEFLSSPQNNGSGAGTEDAAGVYREDNHHGPKSLLPAFPFETEMTLLTADHCPPNVMTSTGIPIDFYHGDNETDSMQSSGCNYDSELPQIENYSSDNTVKYTLVALETVCTQDAVVNEDNLPSPNCSSSVIIDVTPPMLPIPETEQSLEPIRTLKRDCDTEDTYVTTIDPKTRKKTFTCVVRGCGRTFPFVVSSIKQHQRREHNIGWDSYLKCEICGTTYPDSKALRVHVTNIHGNGKNKIIAHLCDLCKVKVPVKDIYEHLRGHVGEEYIIKCPSLRNCKSVFCTARSLTVHLNKNKTCRERLPDDAKKYTKANHVCESCGRNLGNGLLLRNHLLRSHENEIKNFPCPIEGCLERFSVRQSARLHLQVHVNNCNIPNAPQSCDVCQVVVTVEEMVHHLKDVHNAQEVLKCPQCPFFFSSGDNLVDHLYVHRRQVLFCHICGEGNPNFFRHFDLRKHYFTVHQIGKKLSCGHCQCQFFSERSLEDHVAKLHAVAPSDKNNSNTGGLVVLGISPEVRFTCEQCNVIFKTKNSLTSHEIKAHGAEPLSCKYCNEKFFSFHLRLRHEKKHQGMDTPKEFPCEVAGCRKIFKQKKSLKYHVSSLHVGEKPYVCKQCGKAFTVKHNLTTHSNSVHLGLRPSVCDICGERFSGLSVLKRHKLIHTGERPFSCELCGQRFRHKEVCKTHVDAHQEKGADFKPKGAMNVIRKRVQMNKEKLTI